MAYQLHKRMHVSRQWIMPRNQQYSLNQWGSDPLLDNCILIDTILQITPFWGSPFPPPIFFRLLHFLSLGDVQSLTMMGFVMAAIDAQSTPPALLITGPRYQSGSKMKRSLQRSSFSYFWPLPHETQRSPVRSALTHSAQSSRRTESAVIPPNLALLDIPEHHPLGPIEKSDEVLRLEQN